MLNNCHLTLLLNETLNSEISSEVEVTRLQLTYILRGIFITENDK